jgi:hypothetical protein
MKYAKYEYHHSAQRTCDGHAEFFLEIRRGVFIGRGLMSRGGEHLEMREKLVSVLRRGEFLHQWRIFAPLSNEVSNIKN